MRPNKLSLTAFGPYHQTEVIDFDKLAPHDLFVVSGNTGAGKTSIFDGLSFALFGGASGEDRKEALSLRSDFASDDLPSSVELFFTIQDRKFRVMRQLAYQKAGNKSITPAKAELYELIEENGVLIETPAVDRQMINDVDQKMGELIGLSKEQFNQLVMLPQGEYQRFLTSSTSDKEAILRTVFNTEKYRALNDTLKASRDQAQKEVDALTGNIQSTIESLFRQLPQRDSLLFSYIDEAGEPSLNPHQALTGLEVEAQFYETEKKRLSNSVQTTYAEHQKAHTALIQGKTTNAEFLKLATVSEHYQLHLAQKTEFDQLQKTIALAEKAQPIEKHYDAVIRLRTEAQQKQLLLKKAETSLKSKQEVLETAQSQLQAESEKEAQREALTREILQLEANAPKVQQLLVRKKQVEQLNATYATQTQQSQNITNSLAQKTAQLHQLKARINTLLLKSDQRIPLIQLMGKLQSLTQSFQTVLSEQENIATIKLAKTASETHLNTHKKVFNEHYQSWLNAQTDRLASMLQPGESCPVCGSLTHPKLKNNHEEATTSSPQLALSFEEQNTLNTAQHSIHAETALTQAQSTLIEAEAETSHLQSQLAQANANLHKEQQQLTAILSDLHLLYDSEAFLQLRVLNLPKIPTAIDLLSLEILSALSLCIQEAEKEAIDAHKSLIDARQQQELIEQSVLEQQNSLSLLKDAMRDIESKLLVEKESLALLSTEIPEALQDISQFQQTLIDKRAELNTLKLALSHAEKAFQHAEKEMITVASTVSHETQALESLIKLGKEARQTLDQVLIKAGFVQLSESGEIISDESAFITAQKTAEALTDLRQKMQQYQEKMEVLRTQKLDLETQLKNQTPAEIGLLENAVANAEAAYEAAKLKSFETAALLKTISTSTSTLTTLQVNYQQAAEKLSRLMEIHDLVRGENSQKISFERYILIEYFERVIEAANLRLQKMTNGQFEFVRSDELASRGKQSGLDLNIYDAYTGEARDVKSLSGGEKFKASLSLSLGMADVIQAHQGGISISTLFIDEGFGALDEESLLQAIDVLIELQKSGRMIGVISHVEELKQALPARIEVTKTPGGFSKTSIIVA